MKILKNKLLIVVFLLLFAVSIFVRFYNLPFTTRFTRDESQNLVDMHRIYVDRDLTILGPIDPTTKIIYPSLTFYMLLPFAVAGGFTPYSPAYGTAFFGVLTVIILGILLNKVNKKMFWLGIILVTVWYPLSDASRWAWNPHLTPFTTSIAILLFLLGTPLAGFLSGIFFGFSFHLHYLTIISTAAFLGLMTIKSIKEKRFKYMVFVGVGFILTIIPFIIFDLKNPPGLFFTKFVNQNLLRDTASGVGLSGLVSFPGNIFKSFAYLGNAAIIGVLILLLSVPLLIFDLKNKKENLIYFLPVLAQVVIISFLPSFQTRYFLLGIVFLFVWFILKREGIANFAAKVILFLMILGSLISLPHLLTTTIKPPDTRSINIICEDIKSQITSRDLKNVNLAVLESVDTDPIGLIYRHTLLVKEVRVLSPDEYWKTDNLFVISTSSVENIKASPGTVLNGFRKGKVVSEFDVANSPWKLYLFNRD